MTLNSSRDIFLGVFGFKSEPLPLNFTKNDTFGDETIIHDGSSEFKIAIDYLLLAILIAVMLSMGCEITKEQEPEISSQKITMHSPSENFLHNSTFDNTTANLNLNSTVNGSFNIDLLEKSSEFKLIIDYLLLAILIVVMLSMGCEITKDELLFHIKRPIGIGIGMFSQFIIMPLTAFALMHTTEVSGLHATGILVIACSPGGVLSNAFAYFCDGDLSLSVAMTSLSTFLAMGMMPLNIWFYGRNFETGNLVIPYDKLALSLVSVTSPVAVGMLLRWKFPRVAVFISKVGSYIGIGLLIVCIVLEVIVFPNMFTNVPGRLYGIVLSLPLIGFTLGYSLAWVFRQNPMVCKTISIECGVQNVPTALTIVSLSFPPEQQQDIILLPWLYGFAMSTGSTVICIAYQIYKKCAYCKKVEFQDTTKEQIGMPRNVSITLASYLTNKPLVENFM